jgi:hypothetical protein
LTAGFAQSLCPRPALILFRCTDLPPKTLQRNSLISFVNCSNSIFKAKLRPCSFALSAAAGTRTRLASRNASHFGATSWRAIPIPDTNYGNFLELE